MKLLRVQPILPLKAPPYWDNPFGFLYSNARSRGGSAGASVIGDVGLVGAAINSLDKTTAFLQMARAVRQSEFS